MIPLLFAWRPVCCLQLTKLKIKFPPPKPRGLSLVDAESTNCLLDYDLLFLLTVPRGAYDTEQDITIRIQHITHKDGEENYFMELL